MRQSVSPSPLVGHMWDQAGLAVALMGFTAGRRSAATGEVTVCKTVGLAYVGSNPTPATTCGNGP